MTRLPPIDGKRPGVASRRGQAAIEFVVGLLLFLLILTGIIHISRLARSSLFLQAVLRGDAGTRAMEAGATSIAPDAIADWQEGRDGIRHTADDQPVTAGAALSSTLSSLVGHSVRSADDWSSVASDSLLPVSMIRLQTSPSPGATLGFVHAEETLHVPVDTFIRELVYDKDEVAIREDVWVPLMGGLY